MNTKLKLKIVVRAPASGDRVDPTQVSPRLGGGSTEVREFLAMMARQRQVRARQRLLKRSALALTVAAAAAWALVALRPVAGDSLVEGLPPAQPPEALVERGPAAAAPLPLGVARLSAGAPAEEGTCAGENALCPASAASVAAVLAPAARCEDDFTHQRWRGAVETCLRAFEADTSPHLAMRVAHSHWARDDVELAGHWASTAVELGTGDADAFLLIGHAYRQAGNPAEALEAYQQYLRSAPRGWHARQVRAAVRGLRPQVAFRQASARREATR